MLHAIVAIVFLLVCYLLINSVKPNTSRVEERLKALEEKIDKLTEALKNGNVVNK